MSKNRGEKQTGHGKQSQGQDKQRVTPTANRPQQNPENVKQQRSQHSAPEQPQHEPAARTTGENITNQDQQRQVTNADAGNRPMGEEETEGDRRDEHLKAYKNPEASGSVSKHSPTVK